MKTEAQKAYEKQYRQTEKYKNYRTEYQKSYRNRPEVKDKLRKYSIDLYHKRKDQLGEKFKQIRKEYYDKNKDRIKANVRRNLIHIDKCSSCGKDYQIWRTSKYNRCKACVKKLRLLGI